MSLIIFSFLIAAIVSIIVWLYVFSIYEVKYAVIKELSGDERKIVVKAIPVNSLGIPAPFRKISTKFEWNIVSGKNLITGSNGNEYSVIAKQSEEFKIRLQAFSEYSLFPTVMDIVN